MWEKEGWRKWKVDKQWSQARPLHHQSFSKSGWGWLRIRPDAEGLGQRTRVSDFMLLASFSASTLRKGMLSLVAQRVKNLPAMQETQDCSLGQESSGEGDVYSLQYTCVKNFIARGAWGLQYMGSQRTGHKWGTYTFTFSISLSDSLLLGYGHATDSCIYILYSATLQNLLVRSNSFLMLLAFSINSIMSSANSDSFTPLYQFEFLLFLFLVNYCV